MKFEMKITKRKGIPYNVLFVDGVKSNFTITNNYLLEICSLANTTEANKVFALFAIEEVVSAFKQLKSRDRKSLEKVIQKTIDQAHKNPCKHEEVNGPLSFSAFKSINHDIHECTLCGKVVRL